MKPKEIDEIENAAQSEADDGFDYADDDDDYPQYVEKPKDAEFLAMAREANQQAQLYSNQINRQSWERVYRAFHQEHFDGSKYKSNEFKNRSRLFIPKTRTAIRKDLASVAASLFGSLDAVNAMPGNEGDARQRASAAVVGELINYRTDRSSGKASIPWFHVAMGARQTSLLTGICLSKQSWKLELKLRGEEDYEDDETGEAGRREVWEPYIDRPNIDLIAPENFIIDPAADWTNPAQDASYLVIKWPMRIDEIRRKQNDPRRPWKNIPEERLRSYTESATEQAAIRRSREQGIDRYDQTQNGKKFDIIWVWEVYVRTAGEDWTFLSIADKELLTEVEPVETVYPEQFGERPLALGYGAFEAFCIFPMSPAESWQMLQQESNDLRNLTLDAIKQNVMPVTKVRRGRNVDLDQLKRRSHGTAIMVQDPTDVTWEKVPDVTASVQQMKQQLDIEFDDLAGQQNYGTVQDNNALGKTLGGLKLAAGAANAVQEFDIRIWIETWCEPVLTQLARLEQFYESDPIVLALCGERAKLMEKYGVDEITDEILENTVSIRVNIGLGSGDPQQRLSKFNSAVGVALPLLQMDPDFKSGKKTIDSEAVMQEVFGAAGYRDGGKRFVKDNPQPMANPAADAQSDKLKSEAEKNRAMAKKAVIDALSNAAKVGLGQQELSHAIEQGRFDRSVTHMDQMGRAMELGHSQGLALKAAKMAAQGLNVDGSPIDMPGTPPGPDYPDGKVPPEDLGPMPGGAAPDPLDMPGAEPGMGGGSPAAPGEPDLSSFASDAGVGVDPATLGGHSVPSADAGSQAAGESAEAAHDLERDLKKPKKRKIKVTKRGSDGRATEFEIEDN